VDIAIGYNVGYPTNAQLRGRVTLPWSTAISVRAARTCCAGMASWRTAVERHHFQLAWARSNALADLPVVRVIQEGKRPLL
jgi:hypothetical protein